MARVATSATVPPTMPEGLWADVLARLGIARNTVRDEDELDVTERQLFIRTMLVRQHGLIVDCPELDRLIVAAEIYRWALARRCDWYHNVVTRTGSPRTGP